MDIVMSKFHHVIIYFFIRTPREENLIIKYKYIGAMKPEHYSICWVKAVSLSVHSQVSLIYLL